MHGTPTMEKFVPNTRCVTCCPFPSFIHRAENTTVAYSGEDASLSSFIRLLLDQLPPSVSNPRRLRTWRRPFLQVSSERSSDSYTLGERRTQRPYFIKSPLSNVPNAALSESACDDRHLSGSYSDSQTPSSPLFLSSKQQFGRGELQLWF